MCSVGAEIFLRSVTAMEDMSESEGGGSKAVERSGGDVKHLIERGKSVEVVDHGSDFVGVSVVFGFEKDDVFYDLTLRG